MTIDHAAIGQRIARYRKINGLTAAQLAERVNADLTRETLAKIETGKRSSLDVVTLASIADALGVGLIALLVPIETPTSQDALDLLRRLDGSLATEATNAGETAHAVVSGMRRLIRMRGERERGRPTPERAEELDQRIADEHVALEVVARHLTDPKRRRS